MILIYKVVGDKVGAIVITSSYAQRCLGVFFR